MKRKLVLSILSIVILTIGCSKTLTEDIDTPQQKKVILDDSDLSKRISQDNLGVIGTKEAKFKKPKNFDNKSSSKKIISTDVASNIPLVLVAEVASPVYEGITLKATHVALKDDYAYVSYNVEGSKYLGAVDVINISEPKSPKIELQAIFPNTDISSINYYNNALYIAGATNSSDIDETNPAVLIKMELENGIPTENIALIDIASFVATDVIANSKGIYGVSGDNGEFAKYNINTNQLINSVRVRDLRALGEKDNKIVVLSGTEGIHVYDANNLNRLKQIATNKDIPDSKRTIDFFENNILVAEGTSGLKFYNIDTGINSSTVELPEVTDPAIDKNEVVTNAVSVTNKHVFMANGAAGIAVHDLKNGISNITKTGTLDIDGSSNYVKSSNGHIFVASGDGGLKIIKIVEESNNSSVINCSGLPEYRGGSWLNVNNNDPQSYSGSVSLGGLNVSDTFTFCGTLAVKNSLNLNNGANFYMSGTLEQGNVNNRWNSFTINNNAKLFVEGYLTIYGNFVLNGGATLEFLGSNSSITVYGDVIKNGNVTITGNYTDKFNKL